MKLRNTTSGPIDLGAYAIGDKVFRLRFGHKRNDALIDAGNTGKILRATIDVPQKVKEAVLKSPSAAAFSHYRNISALVLVNPSMELPKPATQQGFVDRNDLPVGTPVFEVKG